MVLPFSERFGPLEEFVPRERLVAESATVIGVGAIGRQVALQLTALGIPKLQLIDFAAVAPTDVTMLGFMNEDVGDKRVDAVGGLCHRTEPMLDLEAIPERFDRTLVTGSAVFCCVGSDTTRAEIWKAIGMKCRFWGDGRRRGETLRVLGATAEQGRTYYPQTLSIDGDTDHGRNRSTVYAGPMAAGLLVHQFTRYLRGLPIAVDTRIDLSTGVISTAGDI